MARLSKLEKQIRNDLVEAGVVNADKAKKLPSFVQIARAYDKAAEKVTQSAPRRLAAAATSARKDRQDLSVKPYDEEGIRIRTAIDTALHAREIAIVFRLANVKTGFDLLQTRARKQYEFFATHMAKKPNDRRHAIPPEPRDNPHNAYSQLDVREPIAYIEKMARRRLVRINGGKPKRYAA